MFFETVYFPQEIYAIKTKDERSLKIWLRGTNQRMEWNCLCLWYVRFDENCVSLPVIACKQLKRIYCSAMMSFGDAIVSAAVVASSIMQYSPQRHFLHLQLQFRQCPSKHSIFCELWPSDSPVCRSLARSCSQTVTGLTSDFLPHLLVTDCCCWW